MYNFEVGKMTYVVEEPGVRMGSELDSCKSTSDNGSNNRSSETRTLLNELEG